jgi:hypothetical protein
MATGSKFEIPPNVDPAVLKLQAFQTAPEAQEAVANAQWHVRHVPNMTDEPRGRRGFARGDCRVVVRLPAAGCNQQRTGTCLTGRCR